MNDIDYESFLVFIFTIMALTYNIVLNLFLLLLIFDFRIFKSKVDSFSYVIQINFLLVKYYFFLLFLIYFEDNYWRFETYVIVMLEILIKLVGMLILKYLKGAVIQKKMNVGKFLKENEDEEPK